MAEAAKHSGQDSSLRREIFYGDSWFAGVKLAEALRKRGLDFGGPVKTKTSCFPKEELEKIMKHWPSGSHLVIECEVNGEKNCLYAVGYKYSSSKVLTFVFTKNCCDTSPGCPYVAKFSDPFGNTQTPDVA